MTLRNGHCGRLACGAAGRALVLFVVRRLSTLFCGITQLMKDENAKEGHSLLLFGAEGLIERLPRTASFSRSSARWVNASARRRWKSTGSRLRKTSRGLLSHSSAIRFAASMIRACRSLALVRIASSRAGQYFSWSDEAIVAYYVLAL